MKLANEKKLQRHMIRFLMIDSQQTAFNALSQALEEQHYTAQGKLLDDVSSFEKALNLQWDAIIFNAAYDLDYKKALNIIEAKGKQTPVILLSDLSPNDPDILEAYQLGIYMVLAETNYHLLTLGIYRASVYTRLVRREHQLGLEIDKLQQQTQSLVETTEHAVAIFQEGVHCSVNQQYSNFFGGKTSDEFIGQPILDILQPTDVQQFKNLFKRLSKGDFSQSSFNIQSINQQALQAQLDLQFSSTEFEGEPALQLVIAVNNVQQAPIQNITVTQGGYYSLEHLRGEITGILLEQPACGVFTFRTTYLPESLLRASWDILPIYFDKLKVILAEQIGAEIFRLAENTFVLLKGYHQAAQGEQHLKSILTQIPASIDIDQQIFSIHIKSGYFSIQDTPQIDQLKNLIQETFQSVAVSSEKVLSAPSFNLAVETEVAPSLPTNPEISPVPATPVPTAPMSSEPEPAAPEIPKEAPAEEIPVFSLGEVILKSDTSTHNPFSGKSNNTNTGAQQSLLEQIENNKIVLNFQQLYDKEDIDTHLYEVSASFTHEDKRIDIADFEGLSSNPDLAVKLDRWILVEASKRLHLFLNSCPKARIVVNLHTACFNDSSLVLLLTKLVNLINSKYTKPLLLQFREEEVLTDMNNAQKFFQATQEYGIGITISNFGQSVYSSSILKQHKLVYAKLAPTFTALLSSDDGMVELQEKLDAYKEQCGDVRFVLNPLDDMTEFANAWNVDARYLQGNYFQAPQSEFVDNAG